MARKKLTKKKTKSKTNKTSKIRKAIGRKSRTSKSPAKKKLAPKKKQAKKTVTKKTGVKKNVSRVPKKQRATGKKSSKPKSKETLESQPVLITEQKSTVVEESVDTTSSRASRGVEDILFKLPRVDSPIVGSPKDVQKELDCIALNIQEQPDSTESNYEFNRIHLYMHGYLLNVALKQFPYIRGLQTVDIYQETLISLRFKAIPNFKNNKGMSFLNFAKMCIRRHLITLLNASKNRQRDQSINQAVSLDSTPHSQDGSNTSTLGNMIPDGNLTADKQTEKDEAYYQTKLTLINSLSEFEQVVLEEYLNKSTYKEIAENVTDRTGRSCETKSVDNALLRIRSKACQLLKTRRLDDIPLFIE